MAIPVGKRVTCTTESPFPPAAFYSTVVLQSPSPRSWYMLPADSGSATVNQIRTKHCCYPLTSHSKEIVYALRNSPTQCPRYLSWVKNNASHTHAMVATPFPIQPSNPSAAYQQSTYKDRPHDRTGNPSATLQQQNNINTLTPCENTRNRKPRISCRARLALPSRSSWNSPRVAKVCETVEKWR